MATSTPLYQLPVPEDSDNNDTVAVMEALTDRLAEVLGAVPMTSTQRDSLTSSQRRLGMLIYNTSLSPRALQVWNGTTWATPVRDFDWLVPQMAVGDIITASGSPRVLQRIAGGDSGRVLTSKRDSNGAQLVPAWELPNDPSKLPLTGGQLSGLVRIHSFRERETASASSPMAVDFNGAGTQRSTVTGPLTFTWSNVPAAGSGEVASVTLILPASATTLTFPAGTRHPHGVKPVVDGETWLLAVARQGTVTVGTAWAGIA